MFFNYFVPADAKINTCPHTVLTDSGIKWDPHEVEMTTNMPYGDNDIQVNAMKTGDKRRQVAVEHESDIHLGFISSHLVPEVCYERLINSVTVNSFQHSKSTPNKEGRTTKKVKANTRHSIITAEHLARNMNIGLERSTQMMTSTTQKGLRIAVHPITRRYIVDHLDLHTVRL